MRIVLDLSMTEATAVLGSLGFTNGHGVSKLIPLKTAETKVIRAVEDALVDKGIADAKRASR